MVKLEDIYPLTDFQRSAKQHIERMRETGRPEVLTVNGKAAVVVQDVASYQRLLELADRMEALEGVSEGLEQMERGEGVPVEEAFDQIRRSAGRG